MIWIGQVLDHRNTIRRDPFVPQPSGHACAKRDVRSTLSQRAVTQSFQHGRDKAHTRNIQRSGHFRKQILDPINQNAVPDSCRPRGTDRHHPGIGLGHNHIARLDRAEQSPGRAEIKCQIVEHPAPQTGASEPRGAHTMYVHAANHFLGKERRSGIGIQMPAGNRMDVLTARGKIEGEIAEKLTRRRVVWGKVAVDEDGISHKESQRRRTRSPRFLSDR